MLYNPFPVPSLCKLNHISVCFIQISTKITYKQLIPFRESHVFFKVIPGVLGRSVNFNIIQRFLLRRPVFPDYFSASCDYAANEQLNRTPAVLRNAIDQRFDTNSSSKIKSLLLQIIIKFVQRTTTSFRSNCSKVYCKKGVLKNFPKFTGKHLHQSLFLKKLQT